MLAEIVTCCGTCCAVPFGNHIQGPFSYLCTELYVYVPLQTEVGVIREEDFTCTCAWSSQRFYQ